MVESMPEWSREELEAECVRRLQFDPATRGTTRVGLVRLNPEGSGPNWTIVEVEPQLTPYGWERARSIVAAIAGNYAMASD